MGDTDLLAGPDRARRSFAEANWLRINELRIVLDPDGLSGRGTQLSARKPSLVSLRPSWTRDRLGAVASQSI